jgi:uncharacterized coiled-coil DUF342 family protein
MAEMENEELRRQIVELRREIEELHAEADLDECHIAGLTAQIKALLAESEACPNKAAHPLVERAEYVDSRTGQTITKTKALPLYREAFDAAARNCGIEDPERHRS